LKSLRWFFTSHIFLALIAVQVFVQVWSKVVDMPILGLFLTLWLSWKLGCLAGWADFQQRGIDHARLVAKDIAQLQEGFEGQPEDVRLAMAVPHSRALESLTWLHQRLVAQLNTPYVPTRLRDVLPSPTRWLARRRERQIMATDKVQHP
jgi:hypothetical protein